MLLSYLYRSFITFAIGIVIMMPSVAMAQISPGDLAEPHAHLEGMSNCTECHTLGEKVSNSKCLDCHKLLASRINNNKGYHASSEIKGKECISCHSDHHGRKFQMIRFDKEQFNHDLTGYNLEGKHLKVECTKCHNTKNIVDNEVAKKDYTYLGLSQNCISCHVDKHENTLGDNCYSCHGFDGFKPATRFNHDKSDYILKGKHKEVSCEKCHKEITINNNLIRQYTNIAHSSCNDCHNDVHDNKFGNNCARCHTELSFYTIIKTSGFDHSLTGYDLTGKHLNVACEKCHKNKLTDPVRHSRCTDCHDDFHKGQLLTENVITDCKECHTTKGFHGSSFSLERHNNTSFELRGSHMATPCFVCHKKENEWMFKGLGTKCADCHKDIHANELDAKYYPDKSCTSCHNEYRWSQITFEHHKTGYILEDSHKLVSCKKCHFKPVGENKFYQHFKSLDDNCTECHQDIHYGQFIPEKSEIVCLNCHQFKDWQPSKFDHNETLFPLDGKHLNVACNKCHKEEILDNKKYRVYKIKDFKCEDCH